MALISEIYSFLCDQAPLELQMSFDNSGLQIGCRDKNVDCVLLALDVTDDVVREAENKAAGLIITHHPLIFTGIKSIDGETPEGRRLLKLAANGISVISMHTNLDISAGGVNDVLIELF